MNKVVFSAVASDVGQTAVEHAVKKSKVEKPNKLSPYFESFSGLHILSKILLLIGAVVFIMLIMFIVLKITASFALIFIAILPVILVLLTPSHT